MDIREYLQTKEKGFYEILCNSMTVERQKQFYDAINNWHESELKSLGIADVVGRSELLLDFAEYINKFTPSPNLEESEIDDYLKQKYKNYSKMK